MHLKVGLLQMNSGDNKEDNLVAAHKGIEELAARGARFVMMPEHFNYLGPESEKRYQAESFDTSQSLAAMAEAAARHGIYLHIGSFLEKEGDKAYNTSVVFGPTGDILAQYRKIHLFDVQTPGGVDYLESKEITAGDDIVTFAIDDCIFGMAICYDLRFPELFRALAQKGAHVLLVPAAFTLQTGRDHWELLLRARAVENLCWVVAAGQIGKAPPRHHSFGRSMVISPWGLVTSCAPDHQATLLSEIDLEELDRIRLRFPALNHIRHDLF